MLSYCLYVLSALGVSHIPDKIGSLITDPKNLYELRMFLGFAGCYCSVVKGFAQIVKPLHQLVEQQSKQSQSIAQFQWMPTRQKTFVNLYITNPGRLIPISA